MDFLAFRRHCNTWKKLMRLCIYHQMSTAL